MKALIRAELASRAGSLLGLAAGAFCLLLAIASAYSALATGALSSTFAAGSTPRAFSALTGARNGELLTPHGWLAYGFNHPLFLVLTLAVAIGVAAGTPAGDVENGRAELLFATPRRRRDFLLAALAVWAVGEVAVVLAALAGALTGGLLTADLREAGLGPVVLAPLQYLPLAAFVAAVGFLASAQAQTRGRAVATAVGATVLGYLANFVAGLVDGLDWLRWLSPFGYYDPIAAVTGGLEWGHAAVLLAGAALLLAAADRRLRTRDLV